jgi:negative regulator of flagellin synthesis FlgM
MDPSLNHPSAAELGTGANKESAVKIDIAPKTTTAVRGKEIKSALGLPGRPAQPAEPASVSDDVKLTDTAEKLQQLERSLSSVDISNSGKVETIRQAIADGNFKVNEEAVAENLIQESITNISHRVALLNP